MALPRMLPPSFEGVTLAEVNASVESYRRFATPKQLEAEAQAPAICAAVEAENAARLKKRRWTG